MRLKSCFLLALLPTACGLSAPAIRRHASLSPPPASARLLTPRPPAARTPAPRAQQSSDASDDFTSAQKMREEVEAPFAKVRLFAFPVLFADAAIQQASGLRTPVVARNPHVLISVARANPQALPVPHIHPFSEASSGSTVGRGAH